MSARVSKKSKTSKPTIVLLKSDSCGHCNNFKPTWDDMCAFVQDTGVDTRTIDYGDVDRVEPGKLRDRLASVTGVPFVAMVTRDGEVVPFDDARDMGHLLHFMIRNLA